MYLLYVYVPPFNIPGTHLISSTGPPYRTYIVRGEFVCCPCGAGYNIWGDKPLSLWISNLLICLYHNVLGTSTPLPLPPDKRRWKTSYVLSAGFLSTVWFWPPWACICISLFLILIAVFSQQVYLCICPWPGWFSLVPPGLLWMLPFMDSILIPS